jgi:hypothetical protein
MTEEAFEIAFRSFNKRRPFRPFYIELVSGARLLVAHPEAILVHGELLHFRDRSAVNHLFQIESVCQIMDVPPKPTT